MAFHYQAAAPPLARKSRPRVHRSPEHRPKARLPAETKGSAALDRERLGRNPARLQELADLHHLGLEQAVVAQVQNGRTPVERHADPTLRLRVDLGSEPR